MKITKYEHACLVIEEGSKKLVIDPGIYSSSFTAPNDVCGVVITHVHADHLDIDKLRSIAQANPGAQFFGTQEVADEVKGAIPITIVHEGETKEVGGFSLEFFGKEHATLTSHAPIFQNVGLMVNDTLYYPGDSFVAPNRAVRLLAIPAGSPWANIAEEVDFLERVKPEQAFPTHNAHLSDIGMDGRNSWLRQTAEPKGITYTYLKPGESLTV